MGNAEWPVISETLRNWVAERAVHPLDLGVRVTYVWDGARAKLAGPDCDFAVPFA